MQYQQMITNNAAPLLGKNSPQYIQMMVQKEMAVLGPEINEANYIAMALSKRVVFSVILTLVKDSNKIVIKVDNQDLKQ